MSSRPTKITKYARRWFVARSVDSYLSFASENRKKKYKEEKERNTAEATSLADSLSHGTRSWQLLTFIRTPCRSFHVVSFGHRAARCIPMQITLAPGTRRNRRNFMLLRNATCPPPGPWNLSFHLNERCRGPAGLSPTIISLSCMSLSINYPFLNHGVCTFIYTVGVNS